MNRRSFRGDDRNIKVDGQTYILMIRSAISAAMCVEIIQGVVRR